MIGTLNIDAADDRRLAAPQQLREQELAAGRAEQAGEQHHRDELARPVSGAGSVAAASASSTGAPSRCWAATTASTGSSGVARVSSVPADQHSAPASSAATAPAEVADSSCALTTATPAKPSSAPAARAGVSRSPSHRCAPTATSTGCV